MQAIKPVGKEVVSNAVPAPLLTPAGVGGVPLRGGPAYAQVSGFSCHEGLRVVHHQLVVPLLVLSGPLTDAQENIGPHASKRQKCT